MAFIEDSTPQKITAKILSVGVFRVTIRSRSTCSYTSSLVYATSTITELSLIFFTSSSVISLGAFAPGVNTAPITASASFVSSSILC